MLFATASTVYFKPIDCENLQILLKLKYFSWYNSLNLILHIFVTFARISSARSPSDFGFVCSSSGWDWFETSQDIVMIINIYFMRCSAQLPGIFSPLPIVQIG